MGSVISLMNFHVDENETEKSEKIDGEDNKTENITRVVLRDIKNQDLPRDLTSKRAAGKEQKENKAPIQVQSKYETLKVSNAIIKSTNTKNKPHSSLSLKDIHNIDDNEEQSLIFVTEYVNDIYEYLFQLEKEQTIRKEHLNEQFVVTFHMRSFLLDWLHKIHLQFNFVSETFHITVGIIDRYLQNVPNILCSDLQLFGITCLFIAAKYEESCVIPIFFLNFSTNFDYERKQFFNMERQILRSLKCNLSFPCSIHFLRRFSKAADIDYEEYTMSKYFLELIAIEYDLAYYRSSKIAAASLFLTLQLFKGDGQKVIGYNDTLWNKTLEFYSRYKAKHLRSITVKIAKIVRYAPNAKLTAVYKKYQLPEFYKISLKSILYSPLMDSLIKYKDD